MSASAHTPQLPRDFVLVEHDALPDTVSEAGRLAGQGAEEGTVVWAHSQPQVRTPSGDTWLGSEGDLHCALVLRPEFPREVALQLVYVAALSVGAVLSEQVSAMTTLHYGWPDQIRLRGDRVGAIRVAAEPSGEGFEWLALGLDLNVVTPPEPLAFSAAALHTHGECETDRALLLEDYCRYFLRTINRWAEDGFSPILKAWLQRVPDLDQPVRVRLAHRVVEGVLRSVNVQGAAVLQTEAGEAVLPLSEFYGLQ